jgi:hypothetical protein
MHEAPVPFYRVTANNTRSTSAQTRALPEMSNNLFPAAGRCGSVMRPSALRGQALPNVVNEVTRR